jgi:hypothetical protein
MTQIAISENHTTRLQRESLDHLQGWCAGVRQTWWVSASGEGGASLFGKFRLPCESILRD